MTAIECAQQGGTYDFLNSRCVGGSGYGGLNAFWKNFTPSGSGTPAGNTSAAPILPQPSDPAPSAAVNNAAAPQNNTAARNTNVRTNTGMNPLVAQFLNPMGISLLGGAAADIIASTKGPAPVTNVYNTGSGNDGNNNGGNNTVVIIASVASVVMLGLLLFIITKKSKNGL